MFSIIKSLIGSAVSYVIPSWVSYALIGVVLAGIVAAYFGWSYHLQQVGAEKEKANELMRAITHQQEITQEAAQIDRSFQIQKDGKALEMLRKNWSTGQ
jgi:hypothetical protein